MGKLASSRNAISHGILSSAIVLEGESQDRFCELFAGLLDEFQPQTPFEESLIENMAAACWRQMRIWSMEKTSIECEMHRQAESPYADLTQEDAAVCASRAFRRLSDDSHSLELIHRYDTRYERQYYRAHRRFLEVHDLRTPPATPSPQIVSISKGTREVVENKPSFPGNPGSESGDAATSRVPGATEHRQG